MRKLHRHLILTLLVSLMGVSEAGASNPPMVGTQILIQNRVVNIYSPKASSANIPRTLVILLHSYGGTGKQIDAYLQFGNLAKQAGFIYATVEGTKDGSGKQFWNATPSCCNFAKKNVDEAAFFRELLAEIQKQKNIDPLRIFIVGTSNGGFMAHSLACTLSPDIAGIISIAGEQFNNPDDCRPTDLVNILQIQGMSDPTIPYSGGNIGLAPFPGAERTLKIWATKNDCDLSTYIVREMPSLVYSKPQVPSLSKSYSSCPDGGNVELWAIPGAGHMPNLNTLAQRQILNWLLAHPKVSEVSSGPSLKIGAH